MLLFFTTFLHDNLHEKMSWHGQNLMIHVVQLDLRPSAHKKSHMINVTNLITLQMVLNLI